MPAIPSIASFTGASVTEGEFKTALANLHLFLSDLLGTDGTQAGAQAALGAILGAGAATKTAAYTVDSTDRGKVIACSGTFTVTLPDAAAVGSGFAVAIGNYGDGTVTVDPFSTQTIDGAATKTLAANTMLVACAVNGEWLTVGGVTLPTASTSTAGIVQLSTSVSSTDTTQAATPSAVKSAYDLAASKAAASHTHPYVSTNMAHDGVGSLCYARNISTSTIAPGGTIAGASLRPACGSASSDTSSGSFLLNPALSGTWRALGWGLSGYATLWQRIS